MEQVLDNGAAAGRPYKRKVKNFLIDRSFQLRWVGAVVLLTTLLLGVLGGYIVHAEEHASDAIIQGLNAYYEAEEAALMAEMFQADDSAVLWVLMGNGFLLVLLLAGVGIIMTHKVAGPMVAMKHSLDAVAEGRYQNVRGFRTGDAFPKVSEALVVMARTLRERELDDVKCLETIRATCDLPDDARNALTEAIAVKRARLG